MYPYICMICRKLIMYKYMQHLKLKYISHDPPFHPSITWREWGSAIGLHIRSALAAFDCQCSSSLLFYEKSVGPGSFYVAKYTLQNNNIISIYITCIHMCICYSVQSTQVTEDMYCMHCMYCTYSNRVLYGVVNPLCPLHFFKKF